MHLAPADQSYYSRIQASIEIKDNERISSVHKQREVFVKHNMMLAWKQFLFGWHENWNMNKGFVRSTTMSAAVVERSYNAYVQLLMQNESLTPMASVGGSYKLREDLDVLAIADHDFKTESVDLAVGVDYRNKQGLGLKLAYFHKNKIATAFSYSFNKHLTAALLFDVRH